MKNGQTKFRVHRGLTENLLYLCVSWVSLSRVIIEFFCLRNLVNTDWTRIQTTWTTDNDVKQTTQTTGKMCI